MGRRIYQLFIDSITYGSSGLVGQAISFLLLPVFTSHLSPTDYGVLAMVAMLTAILTPLSELGMPSAVFRRFCTCKDENEKKKILASGFTSILLQTIFLVSLGVVFSERIALSIFGSVDNGGIVVLTLFASGVAVMSNVPVIVLRARREVGLVAKFTVCKIIIGSSLSLFLVVQMDMGPPGIVLGNLVSDSAICILAFSVTFRWFHVRIYPETWRWMIRYALPILPHRLQAVATSFVGLVLINHYLSLEDVGIYNVALKFAMPLTFVVDAVQRAWVPMKFQIASEDGNARKIFSSIISWYICGLLYLWLLVALWIPDVVRLITEARFESASKYVALLALVPVAQGFRNMMGTGLEMGDNMRPAPIISFAGLLVVLGFSMYLIPRIGIAGAAIASAAAWLTMAVLTRYYSESRYSVPVDWILFAWLVGGVGCLATGRHYFFGDNVIAHICFSILASIAFPILILWKMNSGLQVPDRINRLFDKLKQTL
jgi:O-antigen/teichoic acid export membrane protein